MMHGTITTVVLVAAAMAAVAGHNGADASLGPCSDTYNGTCCVAESCEYTDGNDTLCYCDYECHFFDDCCEDIQDSCPFDPTVVVTITDPIPGVLEVLESVGGITISVKAEPPPPEGFLALLRIYADTATVSQDFEFPAGALGSDILLVFSDSPEVSVSIPIIDDDSAEGEEQFTVALIVYGEITEFIDIKIIDDDDVTAVYPTGCTNTSVPFDTCCDSNHQTCVVFLEEDLCWCDHSCHQLNDCCPDIQDICPESVTVQFSSNTAQLSQVSENEGEVVIQVEAVGDLPLPESFVLPVTITLEGYAGAINGADYALESAPTINLTRESPTAAFHVHIIDDDELESSRETILVFWAVPSSVPPYTTLNQEFLRLVILDNDGVPAPPTFRFVQTDYTAMEGESLELQVERVSQIPRNYDVLLTQISLKNNPRGASRKTDFSFNQSSTYDLIVLTTDDRGKATVEVHNDKLCEGNETIAIELLYVNVSADGYQELQLMDTATILIYDQDCSADSGNPYETYLVLGRGLTLQLECTNFSSTPFWLYKYLCGNEPQFLKSAKTIQIGSMPGNDLDINKVPEVCIICSTGVDGREFLVKAVEHPGFVTSGIEGITAMANSTAVAHIGKSVNYTADAVPDAIVFYAEVNPSLLFSGSVTFTWFKDHTAVTELSFYSRVYTITSEPLNSRSRLHIQVGSGYPVTGTYSCLIENKAGMTILQSTIYGPPTNSSVTGVIIVPPETLGSAQFVEHSKQVMVTESDEKATLYVVVVSGAVSSLRYCTEPVTAGVSDFQFVSCSSPAEIVLTEGVGRIDVEIQQDDVVESNIMEKFYVWIYIGSQRQESRAVVYIQDMSSMTVEFAEGDHISTDEKLLKVALFITGTADFEIFVNLTAKEDLPRSATVDEDFPSQPMEITILAHTDEVSPVSFMLMDDCRIEGSETFQLFLQDNGIDDRISLSTQQLTATITDDDVMKARFVSNSFTIDEAGGDLEVVQGLLENCSLNVGVEYTITFNTEAMESTANGTDIRRSTAAISFQPADLSKSLDFSLYIEDDCILEANEAVNLVLVEVDASVSRVVSPHSAILEIVDDDSVTVGFSSTKYHANEGETVDIEVVLTGAHAVDVAVVIQVALSVSVNAVEGSTVVFEGQDINSLVLRAPACTNLTESRTVTFQLHNVTEQERIALSLQTNTSGVNLDDTAGSASLFVFDLEGLPVIFLDTITYATGQITACVRSSRPLSEDTVVVVTYTAENETSSIQVNATMRAGEDKINVVIDVGEGEVSTIGQIAIDVPGGEAELLETGGDVTVGTPTVQFVTTTASCREPKKERDRSRQVLKHVCCFEVERIGASSSLLEIGVITRNGTAIANAAIGDFNTVPYPHSGSLGGPGYLRFNASDGNETAEICVDVNYDDCNEHEQEDFTLQLIPRADHDVMIGENNMLTVNIPISASQTNQQTQAGEEARLEVIQESVCEGELITYQFVLDGGSCEDKIPFQIYLESSDYAKTNGVNADLRKVPFNDIVFHDNATGTLGSSTSVRLPDDYFSRRPRYYYDGNRTEIEAVFLPKRGDLAHTRTVNDNVFEGPEKFTFILAILYPSFVTLKDNKNQHTVTVYDNDDIGARVVPNKTVIQEGMTSLTLMVELFDPTNVTLDDLQANLQVSVDISGDTNREVTTRPVPASITFIPVADGGSNSYEIKINLQAGNNILQPDRTFFVELTTNNCSTFQSTNSTVPCNCPQSISCGCKIVLENAIVTIQDDDDACIRWRFTTVQVLEESGNVSLGLQLRNPNGQAVEVPYPIDVIITTSSLTASDGDDYSSVTTTVTIEPGIQRIDVIIPILDDNMVEKTEKFVVTLNLTLNDSIPEEDRNRITVCGSHHAEVEIIDSDLLRLKMIPVDKCFSEDMTVRIPINKTGEHQDNFTVNIIATDGTAEENVDFRLRQTAVTFTPSDQEIDIEIDILKDNTIDTNELFSVSIEIPPDEPLRPRITIDTPSTVSINISCDEVPPRFPSCNVSAAPCDTDFAELQCIHSLPGPVVYSWSLNGTVIVGETNETILPEDEGTYTCSVTSRSVGVGSAQCNVTVGLIPTAVLNATISGVVALTGGGSCNRLAEPVPSDVCSSADICLQVGETLELDCVTNLESDGIGLPQGTLVPSPYGPERAVDSSLQGVYNCSTRSDICDRESNATRCVFVYDPARCTQYTLPPTMVSDSDIVVGSVSPSGATLLTSKNITEVQLYCGLSGIPPPSVTWLGPDGSTLMGSRYSVMETDSFSMLTISNYNVNVDAGQYSCLAENIGGEQTCSIALGARDCNCVIGEWSECCPDCRRGYRYREIICDSIDCSPPDVPTCQRCTHLTNDCNDVPMWKPWPWVACSKTCGLGRTFRTVDCFLMSEGRKLEAKECDCPGNCNRMPRTHGPCKRHNCCVRDVDKGFCAVVKQARLCGSPYYREKCCMTCKHPIGV